MNRYHNTSFDLELLELYREHATDDSVQIAELSGMGNSVQVWLDHHGTCKVFGFASWGPAGVGSAPYLAVSFGKPGHGDYEHGPRNQAAALAFAANQTFVGVFQEHGYDRDEASELLTLAFDAQAAYAKENR